MGKKFMLVAALAGILSLGACVDDKESASVEAIRGAKAKQLEAMANLYNAQAEAELIIANAEKAFKEAEIAYKKAETEAMQASADQQKLLLDKAKELYAIELEAAKAKAQAEIAKAKAEEMRAEQDLLDVADERIAELYGVYALATGELATLNSQLLSEQITLKGLKGNLISAEAVVKQQTIQFNNTIAQQTALRDALKALPANDREALKAEIEEYNAALKPLVAEQAVKNDAYNKAYDAYWDERYDNFDVYNSSSIKVIEAVRELRSSYSWSVVESSDYELTVDEMIQKWSLVQSEVTRIKNNLVSNIYYAKEYLGKPTAGTTAATGVYIQYEVLKDNQKTAQDAFNADDSEANRYNLERAKVEVQEYEENTLAYAQKNLADANARSTEFNALVATFAGDDLKAYESALVDLKKLAVAYEAAVDAMDVVNDKIAAINSLKNSVQSILFGTQDLPQLIADAEAAIANAQKSIANLSQVDTAEKAIALSEAEIAVLESKIAAQKIIVSRAKTALDAALKA